MTDFSIGNCKVCQKPVFKEDKEEYGSLLCYSCGEDCIENAEEKRRRRIAEANEY